MSETVLELRQAVKRHSQGGVSFELQIPELSLVAGKFVAVVGESGCGKSSLLDILALISRPLSCDHFVYFDQQQNPIDIYALWQGQHEAELATLRRCQFGYILQTGGLLPFLTVAQNIALASHLNPHLSQNTTADLQAKAARIGIADVLHKKPQYLSGGQRQRAAILRALQHQPRIVLADEPTGAVDKQRAIEIVNALATLAHEHHSTIVMVTHDHDLVAPFAHKTYSFQLQQLEANFTRSTCILL